MKRIFYMAAILFAGLQPAMYAGDLDLKDIVSGKYTQKYQETFYPLSDGIHYLQKTPDKKMIVKYGILREGAIHIDHAWDYFSEKDGEIHHLDLCENCYDEIISGFRIAVEKEPAVEMI